MGSTFTPIFFIGISCAPSHPRSLFRAAAMSSQAPGRADASKFSRALGGTPALQRVRSRMAEICWHAVEAARALLWHFWGGGRWGLIWWIREGDEDSSWGVQLQPKRECNTGVVWNDGALWLVRHKLTGDVLIYRGSLSLKNRNEALSMENQLLLVRRDGRQLERVAAPHLPSGQFYWE